MNSTAELVSSQTPHDVSRELRVRTEANLAYYSQHPDEIELRLRELDEEWDVERTIEAEAAGTILTGIVFGTLFSRKWLIVPVFAASMLLLHNLRGAYPLLPLLRRLGFRTQEEIAAERYALKAMRGDFEQVHNQQEGPGRFQSAFAAAHP